LSDNGRGEGPGNGKASVISALLNGENKLIAVLILLSGGANFWGVKQNGNDVQKAVYQIDQIHGLMDDFDRRQKEQLEILKRLEAKGNQ
jgi:hypothetical protein